MLLLGKNVVKHRIYRYMRKLVVMVEVFPFPTVLIAACHGSPMSNTFYSNASCLSRWRHLSKQLIRLQFLVCVKHMCANILLGLCNCVCLTGSWNLLLRVEMVMGITLERCLYSWRWRLSFTSFSRMFVSCTLRNESNWYCRNYGGYQTFSIDKFYNFSQTSNALSLKTTFNMHAIIYYQKGRGDDSVFQVHCLPELRTMRASNWEYNNSTTTIHIMSMQLWYDSATRSTTRRTVCYHNCITLSMQ